MRLRMDGWMNRWMINCNMIVNNNNNNNQSINQPTKRVLTCSVSGWKQAVWECHQFLGNTAKTLCGV